MLSKLPANFNRIGRDFLQFGNKLLDSETTVVLARCPICYRGIPPDVANYLLILGLFFALAIGVPEC